MMRRSMKRCSSSIKSEVKHGEKRSSNSLKGKKPKLETEAEKNDSKSSENTQENAIHNNIQPKVESSGSCSDEFMHTPDLSYLNLDRFPEKKELTSDFTAIENNILTGVTCLNDSDDSDFESVPESQSVYFPVNREESITSGKTGRKKKTMNSNKRRIKSKQRNTSEVSTGNLNIPDEGVKVSLAPDINEMDVSQLLALGESLGTISKVSTAVTDWAHNSASDSENNLSDWEEVKGLDVKPTEHIIPKEGIEVTLEAPDLYRKRKKKGFDMEAHLRRRLNRMKREFQVLIHKVHLLCWIAHGQYINSVLNSEVLMAQSLSLIPSQHCYPAKHTNLSYLEKIVEWFRKTITIADRIDNESLLPHCESLQKSFQSRTAPSARDLVFMFICVLRALGVKARLLMSLQPLPLKPSAEDMVGMNRTERNKEEGIDMKVEKNDTRDTNEATTSKKSSKEENKFLKDKKSKTAIKLQDEKQGDDNHNHKNKKSSNLNLKTKTPDVKKRRNDADVSEEKMQNLKRTLRARKVTLNMYRDKSESSDEGDTSNQYMRVACKEQQNLKIRITGGRHPHRPATDVSTIGQEETLSKERGSGSKNVGVNINKKRNLSQIASSLRQDEDSDSDFVPEASVDHKSSNLKRTKSGDSSSESDVKSKMVMQKKVTHRKVLDRGVLVSDSGTSTAGKGTQKKEKKKKDRCDVWSEVFLEEEEKWISVDVQSGKLHCVAELHSRATQPVTYVLAFNNDLTLKDVTCRYCVQFSTLTRKLRVDEKWWKESLSPFVSAPTAHDKEEDEELNRLMLDRPMPTTLKEFKNHPLYVLKDDLLKFEALYPPDAPPLGFVRGKPIYARECVHVLHSREIWLKEAKVVRLGETPYKIVKARPKYDKFVKDLPLEVFGSWQVEDYVPPPAVDGKVPRNEYGNVELYKPCMLPRGTVHLQVPGLNRVARKLGIDCAPAVIGFDFHCGGSHPVLDGFVVCEEYKDTLLDAWTQEQDEAEKRQREKLEKRVYGNWRLLIKGLLIRERLKKRYSFSDEAGPSESRNISSRKQSTKLSGKSRSRKGKQKTAHDRCKAESEEEDSDDDNESDKDWDLYVQ
ncbi:hypothetical protein B7P43_G04796 [Cryptotermes secundus]|uniref:DNA repair protein complementing XP-C cells-like protein n=1 Tax=Cryptotermes secundus TaxID=105785 RepID=A0A2J7R341_9NEOP|nr:hypothetical protein B7P43_G04796 [Cryptotermes secundus]